MVTRPPKMLKKHEATPAMPRQVGPMGSMASALAARVMLAAAIPEQSLRPMYHQYAGAAALAKPDRPARMADRPNTFFLPADKISEPKLKGISYAAAVMRFALHA